MITGKASKALRSSPLLFGLADSTLDILLPLFNERRYAAGDCIVSEGSPGNTLYFVRSGALSLTRQINKSKSMEIASLEAGDVFGEMALLTETPRSVTVTAEEETIMVILTRQRLEELRKRDYAAYADIVQYMATVVCRRLSDVTEELFAVMEQLDESKKSKESLTESLAKSRKGLISAFFAAK